ncbi:MAG TPA: hypothetical protein VK363_08575 [Pyrinomonadaceae bacterium]|nr:hypothetical protein [Pyrinomonadaceae bacterium]
MFLRITFLAFMLMLCGVSLAAQSQPAPKIPRAIRNERPIGNQTEDPEQNASHREMLKEMELKREAGDYKEHLARAKENAQLAAELHETFTRQKTFEAADLKKLGRMEKLARQIRNRAGGEEDKEDLKEPPQQIEATLKLLADLSAELQKKVESTPRQVVSASVIKRANEVVELVRHIRTLYR